MLGTRSGFVAFILVISLGVALTAATVTESAAPLSAAGADPNFGRIPLHFESNLGQVSPRVRFLHRAPDYTLFLTPSAAVLTFSVKGSAGESDLKAKALRLRFPGSSPQPSLTGNGPLPGRSHYFTGNDPEGWTTNAPHHAAVRYQQLYPGIDLVFHGNRGRLEYDFIVAPGANPETIRVRFDGVDGMELIEGGSIVVRMGARRIVQRPPVLYQMKDGLQEPIQGRYRQLGDSEVGFEIDGYDPLRPLVIDPIVLVYSSFLGGGERDQGYGIAVDASKNIYVTGETASTDFPTSSPLQGTTAGSFDAFVTKLSADGSTLLYSTYLGGSGGDAGHAIAVDTSGNAYITGSPSANFPTTGGSFDTTPGGSSDCFVAKLSPDGSALVYSTRLGGRLNEACYDVEVDAAGNAYVAGSTSSDDFPVDGFMETFGGNTDGFISKLNADGSALIYSSYLGGSGTAASGRDRATSVAVDGNGNAYVTGFTGSDDFPTTVGAFQTALAAPGADVFVTKLSPDGTALVYSTYLGGTRFDNGYAIAVDGLGNAYITGTTAFDDFPTMNPIQPTRGGSAGDIDAFVTKLNPSGTALIYSTFLGGESRDDGNSIAVDGEGNAIVAGTTFSDEFPTFDPLAGTSQQNVEAFVTKINSAGSALVYSTFLGGAQAEASGDAPLGETLAIDSEGTAYVTGATASADFPTMDPFQGAFGGGSPVGDGFVVKISEIFTEFFAQFGDGGALTSSIVLTNPSLGNEMSGTIEFTNDDGDPFPVDVSVTGGEPALRLQATGELDFTLPVLGSVTITTSSAAADAVAGAAKVTTNGAFGGVIRFTIDSIGTTGVGAGPALSGFIAPIRRRAGGINTGIAVQNTGDDSVTLELRLLDQQGQEVAGGTATIEDLPGRGHISQFVDELFPMADTSDFLGSVVVQATGGRIAATALELGTMPGEFTTLPVTPIN